jgi:hypothetical protein
MSDDVCQNGICAEILDVAGILNISSCSECKDDAGCTDGKLCHPIVNVAELSGQKECVDPGTIEDGNACDHLSGSGDDACVGFCDPADIMGLAEIGVCGPCKVGTGEGCEAGETCEPPTVDIGTGMLFPSMCVPDGGTGGSTGGGSTGGGSTGGSSGG